MPAVGCENISCGSPLYLSNPVPPNEKPFCPNQYRARVVSWDPPSAQFTQLQSSCGGPSHYVASSPDWLWLRIIVQARSSRELPGCPIGVMRIVANRCKWLRKLKREG